MTRSTQLQIPAPTNASLQLRLPAYNSSRHFRRQCLTGAVWFDVSRVFVWSTCSSALHQSLPPFWLRLSVRAVHVRFAFVLQSEPGPAIVSQPCRLKCNIVPTLRTQYCNGAGPYPPCHSTASSSYTIMRIMGADSRKSETAPNTDTHTSDCADKDWLCGHRRYSSVAMMSQTMNIHMGLTSSSSLTVKLGPCFSLKENYDPLHIQLID